MARSTTLERVLVNNQLTTSGSFDNTGTSLAATDVQAALVELDADITTIEGSIVGSVTYKGSYDAEFDFPALDGQTRTLSGTAALDDTVNVVGTTTLFLTEVASGDSITISGETRVVDTVTDDLNLTVTAAFTAGTVSGQSITKDAAVIGITTGDMYTITAGTGFYSAIVETGDTIVAEVDSAAAEADWTIVNKNLSGTFDYLKVNSTGSNAAASGSDSISFGPGSVATALRSIAIGRFSDASGSSSVAIGPSTDALNTNTVSIGNGTVASADGGTAVGAGSDATANNATAVGINALGTGIASVAVGNAADADGAQAIAIGDAADAGGTGTIAIGDGAVAAANGGIGIGIAATPGFEGIVLGGVSSGTQGIAIGHDATAGGSRAIAIGVNADAQVVEGIVIGDNASNTTAEGIVIGPDASNTGNSSIAIGKTAVANGSFCAQIGAGTNSTNNTLQWRSTPVANNSGLISSFTATNYTGTQTVDNHLVGINAEFANKQDLLPQQATVNEQLIVANLNLANGDEIYQHIETATASLDVTLPVSPVNGTHFVIKNDLASTQSFDVTGGPSSPVTLAAGQIYEVVYGDTKWLEI